MGESTGVSTGACICYCMRLARDKAFDRLVRLEKGKTTSRLELSGIHA